MSSRPPEQPESTLERIMGERRDKAKALRESGSDPFRNDIGPKLALAEVRAKYLSTASRISAPEAPKDAPKDKDKDAGITPIDGTPLRVGGRVMAKRGFGKTVFAPIRDTDDSIQLYLNIDHLNADDFAKVLPQLDAGDIVVAEGPAFWTKRGELSILATRLWIVTKSLRPLPDKWHGLTDVEQRYRQRYVDLAVDPAVREVFKKRSAIVRGIRRFLDTRDFLEVETPMMHPIIGGAAARPFVTHHNALDMKLFMRIAPELYLKRLVVGGFDRVYEINRNFRNEGLSRNHNPEFTMLEFYWAYAQYTDLMDLTEAMIGELAREINGSTKVTWDGVEIELAAPWRRLSVRNAVKELGGVADAHHIFEDPEFAAAFVLRNKHVPAADLARVLAQGSSKKVEHAELTASLKAEDRRAGAITSVLEHYTPEQRRITAGHIGYLLFEAVAEDKLVQPTFLTEFPLAVSPLARKNDKDGAFCDRFELFVNGKEIANGFSELNDPDDQRARFQAQLTAKDAGADETMDYDEDYCRALEVGMPPAAGEGIGIDRLAMLLTGASSIRDVILFPLMRPE
ncbi:MAG: lysine--tRNA ligase [Deltaproteobacteria bacterium]|nr:lysine--tRNA ligase [Deltaproteobacteria bacterium]